MLRLLKQSAPVVGLVTLVLVLTAGPAVVLGLTKLAAVVIAAIAILWFLFWLLRLLLRGTAKTASVVGTGIGPVTLFLLQLPLVPFRRMAGHSLFLRICRHSELSCDLKAHLCAIDRYPLDDDNETVREQARDGVRVANERDSLGMNPPIPSLTDPIALAPKRLRLQACPAEGNFGNFSSLLSRFRIPVRCSY